MQFLANVLLFSVDGIQAFSFLLTTKVAEHDDCKRQATFVVRLRFGCLEGPSVQEAGHNTGAYPGFSFGGLETP